MFIINILIWLLYNAHFITLISMFVFEAPITRKEVKCDRF